MLTCWEISSGCVYSLCVRNLLQYMFLLSHVLSLASDLFCHLCLVLTCLNTFDMFRDIYCLLPRCLVLCHQMCVQMCHRILGCCESGGVYQHDLNHYMLRTPVFTYGQLCVVNVLSFLFVMCSNTCLGLGYCHVLDCCVLLLWVYQFITCSVMCLVTFHHVFPDCFILTCPIVMLITFSYVFLMHLRQGDILPRVQSHVCEGLDTFSYHMFCCHLLQAHGLDMWFMHFRSWWLVRLSHILEARLAMRLITCLVRCSSYVVVLRHVLSHWVNSLVGDALEYIFCHLFD